jgi:glyoxylase-like metal-dependent hydrolase (beta-lactamase superfamily II)
LNLIVITHGHWDHIGSARDFQLATGATIAMHESEVAWLEEGLVPLPPGVTRWGRLLASAGRLLKPLIEVPPAKVDLPLRSGLALHEYGIPGCVMFTPGHTSGSVSVLLESGEAFVGDLAMNALPLRTSPGLPVLAEDPDSVVSSWNLLLDAGAKVVYPAHGTPFSADVIRSAITSRS